MKISTGAFRTIALGLLFGAAEGLGMGGLLLFCLFTGGLFFLAVSVSPKISSIGGESLSRLRLGEEDELKGRVWGFVDAEVEVGGLGIGLPVAIALRRASRSSRVYLCGTLGSFGSVDLARLEGLRGAMTLIGVPERLSVAGLPDER